MSHVLTVVITINYAFLHATDPKTNPIPIVVKGAAISEKRRLKWTRPSTKTHL